MEDNEVLAVISTAATAARSVDEAIAAADRYRPRIDRLAAELDAAQTTLATLDTAIDQARADADAAAARSAAVLDTVPADQRDRVLAEHAAKEFERASRLRTIADRRAYKDGLASGDTRPAYAGGGIAAADTATGKGN